MNKLGKKADVSHMESENMEEVEKIFKQLFSVREGEKLLKACQCYLSSTAGPIAGLLFISSQKVAFCSDRATKITSPNGELVRVHYKVPTPLEKIKGLNESENMEKTSQKYMEIVTVDDFEFCFMGFLNYQKGFKYLQQAIISKRLLYDDELLVTFHVPHKRRIMGQNSYIV
ncbi:hypothetical protein GOBAR_DD15933 [Gossypium barbadense]|nr:hypothetical protein GOBAR_DD15933 [Gossypium barbadense]